MPDPATATTSRPSRFERRRAKTRQALVAAARGILAETGETKTGLFDAAVADALDDYGRTTAPSSRRKP